MSTLLTERLEIRPFCLEDAPFILRLLNEPSFVQNIADKGVRTLAQARTYLSEGPLASYAAHGHGLWMVLDRETGAALGMCGLIRRSSLPEPDLGYAFVPEAWGRGYAREAAAACLGWGRARLGLSIVLAIVSPANTASIRLLAALGFERTGAQEAAPGDWVEVYRLSLP